MRDATVITYGSTGQSLRNILTDSAGRYRVTGLLPRQRAPDRVEPSAHRGELYDDVPCDPNTACPMLTGQPVPITIGNLDRRPTSGSTGGQASR